MFKFHVQNMYLICIWLFIYNTYESILERIFLAMPHVHFRLNDTKKYFMSPQINATQQGVNGTVCVLEYPVTHNEPIADTTGAGDN